MQLNEVGIELIPKPAMSSPPHTRLFFLTPERAKLWLQHSTTTAVGPICYTDLSNRLCLAHGALEQEEGCSSVMLP